MYLIRYFLVWCTSRRQNVLKDVVAEQVSQLIKEACEAEGWQLVKLDIRPDHVRLLVSVFPSVAAEQVSETCKLATAHLNDRLNLKMPSMWTRRYFAATGIPSEEAIQKFLLRQREKKRSRPVTQSGAEDE